MIARLKWLFAPASQCGALCRAVEEELSSMRLSRDLSTLAREPRSEEE